MSGGTDLFLVKETRIQHTGVCAHVPVLGTSVLMIASMLSVVFGRCFAQIGSWDEANHVRPIKSPLVSYDPIHRLRPAPAHKALFARTRVTILAIHPLFSLPSRRNRKVLHRPPKAQTRPRDVVSHIPYQV